MLWVWLALLSAISLAVSRIFQKVLLDNDRSDPYALSLVFQLLIAGQFAIYATFVDGFELPILNTVWLNVGAMTLLYSLGNLCVFKAFSKTEASQVAILLSTSVIWTAISAGLLLGERLSGLQIAGIGLVLSGVVIAQLQNGKWRWNRGHGLALMGAMLYGVAFSNDAFILSHYSSVSSYMALAFTLPGLAVLFMKPKLVWHLKPLFEVKRLQVLLICTFFYALAAWSVFSAYAQGGQASIVAPIQQLSVIVTVLMSYVWLGEKQGLLLKGLGSILSLLGIVLLV